MNKNLSTNFVSQLCPKCGLCCNGVLFADVELRKGDDAERLAELGLLLEKKGRKQGFRAAMRLFRWQALPDLRRNVPSVAGRLNVVC